MTSKAISPSILQLITQFLESCHRQYYQATFLLLTRTKSCSSEHTTSTPLQNAAATSQIEMPGIAPFFIARIISAASARRAAHRSIDLNCFAILPRLSQHSRFIHGHPLKNRTI